MTSVIYQLSARISATLVVCHSQYSPQYQSYLWSVTSKIATISVTPVVGHRRNCLNTSHISGSSQLKSPWYQIHSSFFISKITTFSVILVVFHHQLHHKVEDYGGFFGSYHENIRNTRAVFLDLTSVTLVVFRDPCRRITNNNLAVLTLSIIQWSFSSLTSSQYQHCTSLQWLISRYLSYSGRSHVLTLLLYQLYTNPDWPASSRHGHKSFRSLLGEWFCIYDNNRREAK